MTKEMARKNNKSNRAQENDKFLTRFCELETIKKNSVYVIDIP